MFKIPSKENQVKFLDLFRTMASTATKDGKPYILSLAVGQALEDPRSQGYTLVAKSEFSSLDDMKYYDDECEAHKKLRAEAKSLGSEGIMTVYYPPAVLASL